MFVQLIQGQVADSGQLHAAIDRWARELAPGADGWLGMTAGVTEDGDGLIMARFDSAAAAARNSDRPEQHQWWMDTSQLFADEPVFHDSTDVATHLAGGSDDAGFVQVMQGTVRDADRMRQLMRDEMDQIRQYRPDIIGDVEVMHDGGRRFTDVIYFTSEAEAREGERRQLPPELQATFEEMRQLSPELRYYDLKQPWLYSPGSS